MSFAKSKSSEVGSQSSGKGGPNETPTLDPSKKTGAASARSSSEGEAKKKKKSKKSNATPTSSIEGSHPHDPTMSSKMATPHGTIEQSERQRTIQIVNESAEESDRPRPGKAKASKEAQKSKTMRHKKSKKTKQSEP